MRKHKNRRKCQGEGVLVWLSIGYVKITKFDAAHCDVKLKASRAQTRKMYMHIRSALTDLSGQFKDLMQDLQA